MRLHRFRYFVPALLAVVIGGASALHAQAMPAGDSTPRVDLGVSFTALRSLKANTGQNFWMEGGSIQLGTNVWKGWGIAADVSGGHSNSIGTSGIPISMVTATFGPRYRFRAAKKLSFFGQGLVGETNVFRTIVPTASGTQDSGNGWAVLVGGGVDYAFKRHFAVRLIDAGWLRTTVPNSTNNVQNNLRLGAGFVVRFGH